MPGFHPKCLSRGGKHSNCQIKGWERRGHYCIFRDLYKICWWRGNLWYNSNYCIAGNFRGRKLSRIGRKGAFHAENFCEMLNWSHKWVWHAENFVEKTFTGGCKIVKFMKVFSLESFPPYSTSIRGLGCSSRKTLKVMISESVSETTYASILK